MTGSRTPKETNSNPSIFTFFILGLILLAAFGASAQQVSTSVRAPKSAAAPALQD